MTPPTANRSSGIVVIGRNEGERLRRCLRSALSQDRRVVYVDSGSCDDSVAIARAMGAEVVELSAELLFTAARARNAGLKRLLTIDPDIEFVQFVDGDCEIDSQWMQTAVLALQGQPDVAVVCGRRRERFPEASIYNRLCDMEWDTQPGETSECGGDAMFRVAPLRDSGGYKEGLIAGEEPELCVRLRAAGWKILRLDAEMTLHDAAMTQFGQWWKRNIRNGHAFAEGVTLHGDGPSRHWVKQARSNWAWGAVLPLLAAALAWPTRGLSILLAVLLLVALTGRIFRHSTRRGRDAHHAAVYAFFCTLSKFPQALGQAKYRLRWALRREASLIEYKHAVAAAGSQRSSATGA